ncbi:hypothetical protein LNKW23_11370 [Paralimibaculum aggregatum]|uniref:Uncharacterized protein n=1 Tax=Paralimibaculum aggregatum TaxID=3036245 RepID=A0ABQ6LIE3_9RHOB|nr:hypothetical protein [Limibaculum sp. NKW23]GMG81924.1 hypothetical protein LNKW23_11370 [Limibaculum sp. NKW23]
MTDGDDSKTGRGGARGADARAERLAAALRDNLRRRKAQARARRETAAGTPSSGPDAAAPGDDTLPGER